MFALRVLNFSRHVRESKAAARWVSAYTRTHTRTCTHIPTHAHAHTYIYTHAHIQIHTNTHTNTHTKHMYLHTICSLVPWLSPSSRPASSTPQPFAQSLLQRSWASPSQLFLWESTRTKLQPRLPGAGSPGWDPMLNCIVDWPDTAKYLECEFEDTVIRGFAKSLPTSSV